MATQSYFKTTLTLRSSPSSRRKQKNAECSRIQSSNWTLKGTGSPKASGRLSSTHKNNDVDDPIFRDATLNCPLCSSFSPPCPDLHGLRSSSAGLHEGYAPRPAAIRAPHDMTCPSPLASTLLRHPVRHLPLLNRPLHVPRRSLQPFHPSLLDVARILPFAPRRPATVR